MRRWKFLLCLLVVGCMMLPFESSAISQEKIACYSAKQVNTFEAYRKFLMQYPDSKYRKKVEKLMAEILWKEVKTKGTVEVYTQFAVQFPKGPYTSQALDFAYYAVKRSESPMDYYTFLTHFPSYSKNAQVRKWLEEIEFNRAKKHPDPLAMDFFLKKFPFSEYEPEAMKLLMEKRYQQARQWDSAFGYRAFLKQFPNSPYTFEVKSLLGKKKPLKVEGYSSTTQELLENAREQSNFIRQCECSMVLARKIRSLEGQKGFGVDVLRSDLNSILKGETASRDTLSYGSFGGIGVWFAWDDAGWPVIRSVMPRLPAMEAGLRPGDRIVKIRDQSTQNVGWISLLSQLRGDPGSSVSLTVEREGKAETYKLKREIIPPQEPSGGTTGSKDEKLLPFACSRTVVFYVAPEDQKSLAEAVCALLKVSKERIQLAKDWKNYKGMDDVATALMAKTEQVLEDYETNELVEKSLGKGSFGLEGEDKPSFNVREAIPRIEKAKATTKENLRKMSRLFKELDGRFNALNCYIVSLEELSQDK